MRKGNALIEVIKRVAWFALIAAAPGVVAGGIIGGGGCALDVWSWPVAVGIAAACGAVSFRLFGRVIQ